MTIEIVSGIIFTEIKTSMTGITVKRGETIPLKNDTAAFTQKAVRQAKNIKAIILHFNSFSTDPFKKWLSSTPLDLSRAVIQSSAIRKRPAIIDL
jgi:hypothetical protein